MQQLPAIPKVSIIITTYNGVKYISETIESICRQTWQHWELIIVDDGSDDSTCEMIRRFTDNRIMLYEAGRVISSRALSRTW